MAYLVLFDKNFIPLGSPSEGEISTVHVCKSWSLKRKSFEFDEFKAVCKGYKDSQNAVYAGLFENDGQLIYMCLSGIPTTKDDLTTVNGIDVRQVFNQEIPVDYSQAFGRDGKTSALDIYKVLLGDSMVNIASGVSYSGVPYSYDLNNVSGERISQYSSDSSELISPTKKIRNIWEQIQACNANFSCVLVAEWKNDRKTNFYSLTFKVKPVLNVYTIRLKDFNVNRTLNQNVVNHVRVWDSALTWVIAEFFLLKQPMVEAKQAGGYTSYKFTYITRYFSEKCCYPIRSQAFAAEASDRSESADESTEKENEQEACEEAVQTLIESVSKDRVTIDLNSKYGKMLDGIDLSDMGLLVGYYSADGEDSEDKYLPVSAIETDSSGTKKAEFGRLSEYWFME